MRAPGGQHRPPSPTSTTGSRSPQDPSRNSAAKDAAASKAADLAKKKLAEEASPHAGVEKAREAAARAEQEGKGRFGQATAAAKEAGTEAAATYLQTVGVPKLVSKPILNAAVKYGTKATAVVLTFILVLLLGGGLTVLAAAVPTPNIGAEPPREKVAETIPPDYLNAYYNAAASTNVPWTLLSSIGQVATDHGRTSPYDQSDYGQVYDRDPDRPSLVPAGMALTGAGTAGSARTPFDPQPVVDKVKAMVGKKATGSPVSWIATIYSRFGVDLPKDVAAMSADGTDISKTELRPGDLMVWSNTEGDPRMIGVWIGNGQFVVATDTGEKIAKQSLPFRESWDLTFRRVLPTSSDPAPVDEVLFYGDSLTEGMKTHLPAKISGATVDIDSRVGRPTSEGAKYFTEMKESGSLPGIIVLGLGTNDDFASFKSSAEKIIRITKGSTLVWANMHYALSNSEKKQNQWLDEQQSPTLKVVNVAADARKNLAGDGIHLSGAGYRERAQIMVNAVRKAMQEDPGFTDAERQFQTVGGRNSASTLPGGVGGAPATGGSAASGDVTCKPSKKFGEANMQPNNVRAGRCITSAWPAVPEIGGWRPSDPYPDHPSGQALDIHVVPKLGICATGKYKQLGDEIATFLMNNARAYRVIYIMWDNRIWNYGGAGEKPKPISQWRPVYRSGCTDGHYDHVHVSFVGNNESGGLSYDHSRYPGKLSTPPLPMPDGSGGLVEDTGLTYDGPPAVHPKGGTSWSCARDDYEDSPAVDGCGPFPIMGYKDGEAKGPFLIREAALAGTSINPQDVRESVDFIAQRLAQVRDEVLAYDTDGAYSDWTNDPKVADELWTAVLNRMGDVLSDPAKTAAACKEPTTGSVAERIVSTFGCTLSISPGVRTVYAVDRSSGTPVYSTYPHAESVRLLTEEALDVAYAWSEWGEKKCVEDAQYAGVFPLTKKQMESSGTGDRCDADANIAAAAALIAARESQLPEVRFDSMDRLDASVEKAKTGGKDKADRKKDADNSADDATNEAPSDLPDLPSLKKATVWDKMAGGWRDLSDSGVLGEGFAQFRTRGSQTSSRGVTPACLDQLRTWVSSVAHTPDKTFVAPATDADLVGMNAAWDALSGNPATSGSCEASAEMLPSDWYTATAQAARLESRSASLMGNEQMDTETVRSRLRSMAQYLDRRASQSGTAPTATIARLSDTGTNVGRPSVEVPDFAGPAMTTTHDIIQRAIYTSGITWGDERWRQMKLIQNACIVADTGGAGFAPVAGGKAGETAKARARQVYEYLVRAGMTPQGAAGVLGNFHQETGGTFDPSLGEANPNSATYAPGIGLAQWTNERHYALKNKAKAKGVSWTNMDFQLQYLLNELKTGYKSTWNKMRTVSDEVQATKIFHDEFERSNDYATHGGIDHRYRFTKQWFIGEDFKSLSVEGAMDPTLTPSPAGSVNWCGEGDAIASTGTPAALGELTGSPKDIVDGVIEYAQKDLFPGNTVQTTINSNKSHGPTTSGGRSDHQGPPEYSWAVDFSTSEAKGDGIAACWKLAKLLQKTYGFSSSGQGFPTVERQGYRLQLIWQDEGHFDHVHFGVQKLGVRNPPDPLPAYR